MTSQVMQNKIKALAIKPPKANMYI